MVSTEQLHISHLFEAQEDHPLFVPQLLLMRIDILYT